MSSTTRQLIILGVLFAFAVCVFTWRQMRNVSGATKREWLVAGATKAPAALLAVVASYGVAMFYLEAVPIWVSVIGAVAYESVYISLSLQATRKDLDKLRYAFVAFSAVGMSAISNSLYAFAVVFFSETVISGALVSLTGLQHVYVAALLGVLHGAPLSVLSYNMLQLLASKKTNLHVAVTGDRRKKLTRQRPRSMAQPRTQPTPLPESQRPPEEYQTVPFASSIEIPVSSDLKQKTLDVVALWNQGLPKAEVARQVQLSRAGVDFHLGKARVAGVTIRESKGN